MLHAWNVKRQGSASVVIQPRFSSDPREPVFPVSYKNGTEQKAADPSRSLSFRTSTVNLYYFLLPAE